MTGIIMSVTTRSGKESPELGHRGATMLSLADLVTTAL
jgi:hypothetical protein